MRNAPRLWPRFTASLLLHAIVLGGVAGVVWTRYPVSAIPVFQTGEFSLDLAAALPAVPASIGGSPPPLAEIEAESETPPEIIETPEEESDAMQLIPDTADAPIPVPTPAADHPAAPDRPDSQESTSAAPLSGAVNPGIPGLPRLESYIHPIYPPGARQRGEEGKVTVRAAVTASGKAQTAEVIRSSGYPALDQAALNAVRRARFIPARNRWMPVESQTTMTFRFTLVD